MIPDVPTALADLASERLHRIQSAAEAAGISPPQPDELPGEYFRVLACSSFVAESCERQPAMLRELIDSQELASSYGASGDLIERGLVARVAQALDGVADEPGLRKALRRLRRREWVRIAWRDIGHLAGYDETVADLSAFADASIAATLDRLHGWQAEKRGEPYGAGDAPQRLLVLALGKLGARELNFSSDVDLIFAIPSSGKTRGARRSESSDEFFQRLAQALINCLGATTEHGYVFRVDMRLRPFGKGGPLVCTYEALESYYETHGRDWERYALIRARAIAGNLDEGRALLERLAPFVYRRYLDFGTLASLREMKQMITREVERRGLDNNVKLGPGGIREVEFTGQAFQMVRGGRTLTLRDRRILVVLERLAALGLLPDKAASELSAAYRFLRDVEHRLQQAEDRQTHTLPADDQGLEGLACAMRYPAWADLSADMTAHRTNVSTHFSNILEAPDDGRGAAVDALDAVAAGATSEEEAAAALADLGFGDGVQAAGLVLSLLSSPAVKSTDAQGRERLERLLPRLMRAAGEQDEPLAALDRVLRVAGAVARRSAYLSLLYERPAALTQLARLCGVSKAIAAELTRYPQLLDQLLDPVRLYAPLRREALEADLNARLENVRPGDTELEMDMLRQFKHSHALRVAASDAVGELDVGAVADCLSDIAEAALGASLRFAWRDIAARHGEPPPLPDTRGDTPGLCVLAYGKFGSLETGYASDLDLVFVHADPPAPGVADQQTDGEKPVLLQTFYQRVVQRLIHFLTTLTPSGRLYEVDTRLRPQGGAGLLVSSESGLVRYLSEDAWTFELQAIVRARAACGDGAMCARLHAHRRALLTAERDVEALRADVCAMRERMRKEHASVESDAFRVKHDPGGMVDIEFVVQYLTIANARRLGPMLERTGTLGLLEACASVGAIDADDAAVLANAFDRFRERANRLALNERDDDGRAPVLAPLAEDVKRIRERVLGPG